MKFFNTWRRFALILLIISVFSYSLGIQANAEGVVWQRTIGDFKVVISDVHKGYAGPKFKGMQPDHVNLYIYEKDRRGRYNIDYANYHITRYQTKNSSACLYIYESVSKKELLDICSDSWKAAVKKAARKMKQHVDNEIEIRKAALLGMVVAFIATVSLLKSNAPILRSGTEETIDPTEIMNETGIDTNLYNDLGLDQLDPLRVDDPLIQE